MNQTEKLEIQICCSKNVDERYTKPDLFTAKKKRKVFSDML